jgi:hypothetical protein
VENDQGGAKEVKDMDLDFRVITNKESGGVRFWIQAKMNPFARKGDAGQLVTELALALVKAGLVEVCGGEFICLKAVEGLTDDKRIVFEFEVASVELDPIHGFIADAQNALSEKIQYALDTRDLLKVIESVKEQ